MITYVCETCNLKWSTEISTCINCSKAIKIQEGKSLNVIGITTVYNPSTTHPDTPYFVLLVQDEYNNKRPIKTFKQHKIGDDFVY